MKQTSFRLPETLDEDLEDAAEKFDKTKTEIIREGIRRQIMDLEATDDE